MATPYEKVYNRFLNKCTDFDLADLDDYTLENMMKDWLDSAITRTRTSSDLSARDDDNEVFENDLSDQDVELLAMGMVLAWLDQRIQSTEYTNLFVTGKEEKLRQLFACGSLRLETAWCISLNCWNILRAVLLQREL